MAPVGDEIDVSSIAERPVPESILVIPSMALHENRLKSFEGVDWPSDLPTPEEMSDAGFFFSGSEEDPDNVRCPFCLKEMSNWEPGDNPWSDHQRNAKCPLITMQKKFSELTVEDFLKLKGVAERNALELFFDGIEEELAVMCDEVHFDWETLKISKK